MPDTLLDMLSTIQNIGFLDVLDIVIVCVLLYHVFKLARTTRANQVIKGLVVLLIAAVVSSILQMKILSWMLSYIINAGAIIIVVLFQPELRRGLERLGRNKLFDSGRSLSDSDANYENTVDELIYAVQSMSKSKTGALIVLTNKTGLADVESTGTHLDAIVSGALLINIFEPNTPLHDGAVIIKDSRVTAAGCFLPLSENVTDKELGTRHRAGTGITEVSDATVLIVSEETGIISVAVDGKLTRYVDSRKLREILEAIYGLSKPVKTNIFTRRMKNGAKNK